MSKIKTMPALSVIKGYQSNNEVFGKRLMNSTGDNSEKSSGSDFLSLAVVIASDTFASVDPSLARFGKVISSSQERGEMSHGSINVI